MKINKLILILTYISICLAKLDSKIIVNVIRPLEEKKHHFDYHYQDENSKVIFRHSHNNNVNHYHQLNPVFNDLTVSGQMSNIAPSAKSLVNPIIAGKFI